jgi:hypothetical protein
MRPTLAGPRRYSLADYENQHQHPLNKAAHAIGISILALSTLALVLPGRARRRRVALAGMAAGGALLWIGHAIEGNRPAVLTDPLAAVVALKWWAGARSRTRRSLTPIDASLDHST